jgi:hypothetical protein
VCLIRESSLKGDMAQRFSRSDAFASECDSPTPNIFTDAAPEVLSESPCKVGGMYVCVIGKGLQRLPASKFRFQFLLNLLKPQGHAAGSGANAVQFAAEFQGQGFDHKRRHLVDNRHLSPQSQQDVVAVVNVTN